MKVDRFGGICLALAICFSAGAQDTGLTRAEVAAIKAKLVAVQKALGTDPEGYLKESEDFNLPTDISPAQNGKYWPVGASVSLRYTDRAATEGTANAEQAAKDLQAKYAAALASGDPNAMIAMSQDMMRVSQAAAAASMIQAKQDMSVYVQLNGNPYAGIDPDAVVFEAPGIIALREGSGDDGKVTLYLDPVALESTETLSKIELRTPDEGVASKTGVYNVTLTLDGTLADIEAWAKTFDTDAMLAVIDRP